MMKPILSALILCLSLHVMAQPDDTSKEWLSKAQKELEKGPYTADLKVDIQMSAMGQNSEVAITGKQHVKDEKHHRFETKMDINMVDTGGKIDLGMMTVFDGTHGWTAVIMNGQTQVVKFGLADMKALADMQGINDLKRLDTLNLLKNAQKNLSFQFKGITDGKVLMEAPMTQAMSEAMDLAQAGVSGDFNGTFYMTMDEKNVFPINYKIQVENVMNMNADFDEVTFLKDDEVKGEWFTYTPPENAMLRDLTNQ